MAVYGDHLSERTKDALRSIEQELLERDEAFDKLKEVNEGNMECVVTLERQLKESEEHAERKINDALGEILRLNENLVTCRRRVQEAAGLLRHRETICEKAHFLREDLVKKAYVTLCGGLE